MTKTALFTAVSLATLALAGAANAQVVTSTEVSNITTKVNLAGAVTPLTVASESVNGTANRRTTVTGGHNEVRFTTSGDGTVQLEPSTAYRITYALSGTATPTFLAQVQNTALTYTAATNIDCVASTAVAAGTGAGGSNSVSFIVTTKAVAGGVATAGNGICETITEFPAAFQIDLPFGVGALGAVSATISGALDPSNTNPGAATNRFSATGVTTLLAQSAAGYRIFVDATVDGVTNDTPTNLDNADLRTSLALGTSGAPFRTFLASGDTIIGAGGFTTATAPANAANATVYANYAADPLTAPSYTLSAGGDFTTLKPQIDGDDAAGGEIDFTVATNNLTATSGTSTVPLTGGARNIKLRVDGSPTASIASTPQPYTLTVTPIAPAANSTLVTPPAALVSQGLETVGLEGTNFIAPWFSGSQAQSQSQVRLSSTGAAVSNVRITIVNGVFNFNGSPTNFNDTMCAQTFAIPADGDLVITTATVTSCFGNFLRGDLQITVQAAPGALTAKMRNTSSNGTFETTLGRFSGAQAADASQ